MDYREALERAILFIENHLQEDIKVEEVAKYAGYSYYHLTRQFQSILGESVGSYIKKRRLANAAKQLLYTDDKIIDIALDNNFESPEAFSRAFKTMYKTNPQQYRYNRLLTFASSKEPLNNKIMDHLIEHVTVHPKIIELPEIKVVGLRGSTTFRDNKLKDMWEQFYAVYKQIPKRVLHGRRFGICEACNENIHYTINEEMLFSEVVGIEVTSFANIPEPFVKKVIPRGRYAVFTHTSSLANLSQTLDYIWGTWLLSTKEEVDVRETLDLYDMRFLGYDHPSTQIDIYIAIK